METPGSQPTVTRSVAGQSEELARAISAPMLFFYVLGDVLGSGIYALIGVMAAQVGGAFWTSFVVGVAAAMLTGFAYAELITKYPHAAGAAMYTGRAFNNRFFTFLVAFCMVAASLAATGALALAFGGYFLELLVAFVSLPLLLTALVFVVVLAFINFRGISESVKLNLAMSITEIAGLALVLVIGVVVFLAGDADLGRPFEFNEGGNPALLALAGATLAFFAMTGFENAANVAEEVQNPSRVYPRALLGGMASAGLIYLIIAFIASMVVPTGQLADSDVALLEVVRQGFPAFPAWLFAIIACIAVTNTCLVALITNSRIMYGMAREGVVPRIFARTHQSRRTPWVAIVFTTIIALVMIVGVGEAGRQHAGQRHRGVPPGGLRAGLPVRARPAPRQRAPGTLHGADRDPRPRGGGERGASALRPHNRHPGPPRGGHRSQGERGRGVPGDAADRRRAVLREQPGAAQAGPVADGRRA